MTPPTLTSPLGLVAGSGFLPLEFLRAAKDAGHEVLVVAHRDETSPEIEKLTSRCLWVRVGQLGKIVSFFRNSGVKQLAFAGGIKRARIFREVWPDMLALQLAARLGSLRDDVLLRGVVAEFEKLGIQVISPGVLLKSCHPQVGQLTKRGLTEAELADARLGWEAAHGIGALDIGQAVCVLDRAVVAVEAVEGTDRMLLRAHDLAGRAGVLVKLAKPQQDLRIDLPAVGPATIETMRRAGATALILEAGRAIMLEPGEMLSAAEAAGIAIVAFEAQP